MIVGAYLMMALVVLVGAVALLGWLLAWYWGHNWLRVRETVSPDDPLPSNWLRGLAAWLECWESAPREAWGRLLQDLHIIRRKEPPDA